jgi:aerobic carbon-monoxide dehydrogenase large subunit
MTSSTHNPNPYLSEEGLQASRHEDLRLVSGQGRYAADWNLPNQAHAYMIRSDRAHARVVSMDLSAVAAAPGVLLVLTAKDVDAAGYKGLPTGAALTDKHGVAQRVVPMPVLAVDKVYFVGQPIAMVIATSAQLARDASELAQIDYDDLPTVSSVQQALAGDHGTLHEQAPGNIAMDFANGDAVAVDAAFAKATHRSRHRIHSQRLIGAPLELRACLASFDALSQRFTVYTPTQGMLGMRATLCAITGLAADKIDVIAHDVGGSFGLRGNAYSEHVLIMLASTALRRPVKWVANRSELFVSDLHGRALSLEGELALDADGGILAIRFTNTVDLGAFHCYFGAFVGSRNLAVTMGGVYRVPALAMSSRLVFTNTVPVSAYRGAGRPDIAFAIETLLDAAAAEHGFDRLALRRRNFIPKDAFPYQTSNGTVYDCGEFEAVMDKALGLADFEGFGARQAQSQACGKLRGIGLASYLEASGAGATKDNVFARWDPQGQLHLYGVTGPSGQGHETTFAQLVAEGLGIPAQSVRYRASDPSMTLSGNGTGGSRSLYGAGSAFKNLVPQIIARALPHAAVALNIPAEQLVYENGAFHRGTQSIALLSLAQSLLMSEGVHPLDAQAESTSGSTYPNGCHIAEIEIDPNTGITEIQNYSAIDDLGHIVSRNLVIGQVHGGVVQGVGQAFGEHAVYDEATAQLLSGSFMDYPMPKVGWITKIQWDDHPVPTKLNALGAKGVGESGCSGSLPALSNAMLHALRPLGITALDMPFTASRVWEAIQKAGQEGLSDPARLAPL